MPNYQMKLTSDCLFFASSYEVDILSNLLKAQCDMAEWKFLPSLLHLHESHIKLSSWYQVLPPAEVGMSCHLLEQGEESETCTVCMDLGISGLERFVWYLTGHSLQVTTVCNET